VKLLLHLSIASAARLSVLSGGRTSGGTVRPSLHYKSSIHLDLRKPHGAPCHGSWVKGLGLGLGLGLG